MSAQTLREQLLDHAGRAEYFQLTAMTEVLLRQAADRLASLEQQIQEKKEFMESCSTTEVSEAADGGVKQHSAPYDQLAIRTETPGLFRNRHTGETAWAIGVELEVGERRLYQSETFISFALNWEPVESAKSVDNASVAVLSTQQPSQDSKESSLLAQVASLEQAQQALREELEVLRSTDVPPAADRNAKEGAESL